jgi:hypothetical protein
MEPEFLLPFLQVSVTGPYTWSDKSSVYSQQYFPKINFNIIPDMSNKPITGKWDKAATFTSK